MHNSDRMSFEAGKEFTYYTMNGWRLLNPNEDKCQQCGKPLLQNDEYKFYYCVSCQCQQQRENERVDQTPSLLLQHYCMLNDICPSKNCYSPLMRSPDKSYVICGKCGYKAPYVEKQHPLDNYPVDEVVKEIQERTEAYIQKLQNGDFNEDTDSEEADAGSQSSENLIIQQKISQLVNSLQNIDDNVEIKIVADNILKLQKILRNLKV